jgi:hypothetical protein
MSEWQKPRLRMSRDHGALTRFVSLDRSVLYIVWSLIGGLVMITAGIRMVPIPTGRMPVD